MILLADSEGGGGGGGAQADMGLNCPHMLEDTFPYRAAHKRSIHRIHGRSLDNQESIPASILYKSIADRYRPVSYPDGPITARYRFIKNAYWAGTSCIQR